MPLDSGPHSRADDAGVPQTEIPSSDPVLISVVDGADERQLSPDSLAAHRVGVILPVLSGDIGQSDGAPEEGAPVFGEVPRMPTLVTEVAQGGGEWEKVRVDGIGLVEQRVGGEEISVRPLAENALPDDFLEALTTLSPGTPEMGRGNYQFPLHIYMAIKRLFPPGSLVNVKVGSLAGDFRISQWTEGGVQAVRLLDHAGQIRSIPLRNFFKQDNFICDSDVGSDVPQGNLERNTDLRFADVDFREVTS